MKIVYLHQYFSTRDGSAGTRSYEMARRLVSAGHQVTVICARGHCSKTGLDGPFVDGIRNGIVDGIAIIELEVDTSNHQGLFRRVLGSLRYTMRTFLAARRENYDLMFATSTPLTVAAPAILMKKLRGKPFVFEVRALSPELPVALGQLTNPFVIRILSWLQRSACAHADACIGLAPGICDGIARHSSGGKIIEMISNGCDLDLFRPGGERSSLPATVQESRLNCVFAGAHGVANNLDAVLDVASELKKRKIGDVDFLFIGDGKMKSHLRNRTEREGLDNCHFLDPLSKHQLAKLLPAAHVGLQIMDKIPSLYQGTSPHKFFDYLSAGLPVIINYPGWLADILTSEKCGIPVSGTDPSAFADALLWLRDHPKERRILGFNARRLAEHTFNRDELGRRFVTCLEAAYQSHAPHKSSSLAPADIQAA